MIASGVPMTSPRLILRSVLTCDHGDAAFADYVILAGYIHRF